MYGVILNALVLAALAMASQDQATAPAARPEAAETFDLMAALRAADVAEIYIISRGILFPVRPRPDVVRALGCKFRLHRESPEWRELEHALADADVRIAPTTAIGEVRVALILGDQTGILWEIYARMPYDSETTVTGFSQRARVEVSASLVTALRTFAARHRDLAIVDGSRPQSCTRI